MKMHTKIFLVLSMLTMFFIIGIGLQWRFEERQSGYIYKEVKKGWIDSFNRIIELKGKSLDTFVNDYSCWNETVDFAANKNLKWAKENIDASFRAFSINASWIYDKNYKFSYFTNNIGSKEIKNMIFLDKGLKKIFNKKRECHFFIKSQKGIIEVRSATIQPTSDTEKKTPIKGYFFAGRLWDESYLEDLSKLTQSEICNTFDLNFIFG